MNRFSLDKVSVNSSRIVCVVKSVGKTNKKIIDEALKEFPNIKIHCCKNVKGSRFSDVMYETSLAHLFEHIIIDLQTQKSNGEFLGTTTCIAKDTYMVEINYNDDLIALSAIKKADEFMRSFFEEPQDNS